MVMVSHSMETLAPCHAHRRDEPGTRPHWRAPGVRGAGFRPWYGDASCGRAFGRPAKRDHVPEVYQMPALTRWLIKL